MTFAYDDRKHFRKMAMDATAERIATAATRNVQAHEKALKAVAPFVTPMALDSARTTEQVYAAGLEAIGADLRGVPMTAYASLFEALRKQPSRGTISAADKAAMDKQFPGMARVRKA